MRPLTVSLGLGIALLATGCNNWPHLRDQSQTRIPAGTPRAPDLVAYLNENARHVQAIQCNNVAIDCKQGNQAIGLDGLLVCQKPRNFRLKAKVVGQPAVDIGSNNEEFWYWISKAEPPYVYHCSYQNLATGQAAMPFPFQPDMIVAALGMAEYDPNARYQLKEYPRVLELIETTRSAQGQPVQKVTVFNRAQVGPGKPQVVAYVLRDERGKLICQAQVHEVQVDRDTQATLPRNVTLTWPEQKIEMKMVLHDVRVVSVDPSRAERLFQRTELTANLQSFDLYRRTLDGPGLQRASSPPR
jgi:hypothetical protein